MSRLDPKNREEAFTYQFEDDVKMLKVASLSGEKEFEQVLKRLEVHIGAYRSKRLRNMCAKAEKKSKEQDAYIYMEKNFPYFTKIRSPRKKMVSISSVAKKK